MYRITRVRPGRGGKGCLLKKRSTPFFLIGSWKEIQHLMEEAAYEVSSDPNVAHMEPIKLENIRLDPWSFQQWAHPAPVSQHPQKAVTMTQWIISPRRRGIHLPHLVGTHLRSFVCVWFAVCTFEASDRPFPDVSKNNDVHTRICRYAHRSSGLHPRDRRRK